MSTIVIKTLLLMAIIVAVSTEEEPKCDYMTLTKVNCYGREHTLIPQNLKKSIEILDVGRNRIGKLKDHSLDRYPNLQQLYMQSNNLAMIEQAALRFNRRLQILDLSHNLLRRVPPNVFALPKLRKLYLDDNLISDGALDSIDAIYAPIKLLDLSKNKLTRMPRIKNLVDLTELNVSNNFIKKLTVNDLAPLCSLEKLYAKGNPLTFEEKNCDCWLLDKWIEERKIKLDFVLICPESSSKRCSNSVFSDDTIKSYEACEWV